MQTRFSLQPAAGRYLETVRRSSSGSSSVVYAVYDIADIVSSRRVLNIDVKHETEPKQAQITPSTLTAHRFQTGFCFYAQQHICYSVTHVYCIKTAERIGEILSPSDRSIILVFRHQGPLRKSDGFTPNEGTKYKGGSNFRPICSYISERVLDRGIVTMEVEYKVVCALLNSAAFDDLE